MEEIIPSKKMNEEMESFLFPRGHRLKPGVVLVETFHLFSMTCRMFQNPKKVYQMKSHDFESFNDDYVWQSLNICKKFKKVCSS